MESSSASTAPVKSHPAQTPPRARRASASPSRTPAPCPEQLRNRRSERSSSAGCGRSAIHQGEGITTSFGEVRKLSERKFLWPSTRLELTGQRRCRPIITLVSLETTGLLQEQKAYFEARASEYEKWWDRSGRYDLGPGGNAIRREEIRRVEAVFNTIPLPSHILEPSAGTGNWTL